MTTIKAYRHRLAILAMAILAGTLAWRVAEAQQQSRWPTKPGERWVLIGPFAADATKGSYLINLASMKGQVRALRLGMRDQGLDLEGLRVVYMAGAASDEKRRISLNPRDRTKALAATADERFVDRIELTFKAQPAAKSPVLIEVWLLQTEQGANAERPPPPAPKPAVQAAAPAPKPQPQAAQPPPPAPTRKGPPVIPSDRLWPALLDAWRSSDALWQARLVQDQTMQQCYEHNNAPPKAVSAEIQAREKATIVYPADGKFVGDWKKGEALAQSGYGLRFTDRDPKRANGGNCYACHQLAPQELSFGTLGPPLREYGKQRKYAEAEAKAVYERIFNAQSALACSNMPRFGAKEILSVQQIRDLVALLMDPESPVNK